MKSPTANLFQTAFQQVSTWFSRCSVPALVFHLSSPGRYLRWALVTVGVDRNEQAPPSEANVAAVSRRMRCATSNPRAFGDSRGRFAAVRGAEWSFRKCSPLAPQKNKVADTRRRTLSKCARGYPFFLIFFHPLVSEPTGAHPPDAGQEAGYELHRTALGDQWKSSTSESWANFVLRDAVYPR